MAEVIAENTKILIYHGKKHVYKYYNFEYKDNTMIGKRGYYDEHGKYYRNVAFNNEKSIITCKNCGHRFYWTYNKYGIHCPRCYHTINIDIVDTKIKPKQDSLKHLNTIINTAWIIISFLIIAFSIILFPKIQNYADAEEKISSAFDEKINLVPVYVPELKRYCEHLDVNTYYDKDTNCYFKYNVQSTPAQWYYYFVGISEKYDKSIDKKYGWMVYNTYNKKWQVNTAEKTWEDVKEADYTSKMWYFKHCTEKDFE